MGRKKYSPDRQRAILAAYYRGDSWARIKGEYGVKSCTVHRWRAERELAVRPKSQRSIEQDDNGIAEIDEEPWRSMPRFTDGCRRVGES